ncbi:hypothetical protein [uncultured Algibacter sp.]|nr:hypothetical protein [uncultured Algibacter sp.]
MYPAASLMDYAPENTPTYFINPKPNMNLTFVPETATVGARKLIDLLTI